MPPPPAGAPRLSAVMPSYCTKPLLKLPPWPRPRSPSDPRQRPCVREHECTTVNGIHRVQIFVGIDRYRVKSEEPVVEALSADRSSATVSVKPPPQVPKNLVRVYIAAASRAVTVGRTTHRRAERIEVHQEARRIAVRHKQIALRVHRDAGRLVKTRRVGELVLQLFITKPPPQVPNTRCAD